MSPYSTSVKHPDPIDYIDGEVTFTGAIEKYWKPLSVGWVADTQKTYRRHYYEILAPFFVDKPLREFDSLEYFEAVIHHLAMEKKRKSGGKLLPRYSEKSLQHFRYILRKLITIAAEGEGFFNVFLGTDFGKLSVTTPDNAIVVTQTQLQKSFSPSQEYEIAQRLLADPLAAGKWIGLLLMWVFGYRNKEACSIAWGDIKSLPEHPELHILVLHSSNIGSTRKSHSRGKTDNMFRIWVIPPLVYDFLMIRKAHVQDLIDHGLAKFTDKIKTIDDMPVAYKGDIPTLRCTAPELTGCGQQLFKQIRLTEEQYSYFRTRPDSTDILGTLAWDNDPTAYTFRRNVATHLFILGLPLEQCQYLMGHEISNPAYVRNHFSNPDLQFKMYQRTKLRPIINPVEFEPKPVTITQSCSFADVTNLHGCISGSNVKVRIRIIPNCSHEPNSITFPPTSSTIQNPIPITYHQRPSLPEAPTQISMLSQYHSSYFKEWKRRYSE